MKRSSPDTSTIFAGTIMGSAMLAVSILSLLPLPQSIKGSELVNWIVAVLGGIGGAMVAYSSMKRKH